MNPFFIISAILLAVLLPSASADSNIKLTPFDIYFSEDDFTTQGPNHNILVLEKGHSATININIKNNDKTTHQIKLQRMVDLSPDTFASFLFEPNEITVLPDSISSAKLHITVSNETDMHTSFIPILAQSRTFGMKGAGFFLVINPDEQFVKLADRALRAGFPGSMPHNIKTDITPEDAQNSLGTNLGLPSYLPSGLKLYGMYGGDDQVLFYSKVQLSNGTSYSDFWENGGMIVMYSKYGPNFNLTSWLPLYIAQQESQQIMINGMTGTAFDMQKRQTTDGFEFYSEAKVIFFPEDYLVEVKGKIPLAELFKVASSIREVTEKSPQSNERCAGNLNEMLGTTINLEYDIEGGTVVSNCKIDNTVVTKIDAKKDGQITITIPKTIVYALSGKHCEEGAPLIFLDREGINPVEILNRKDHRTITVEFSKGMHTIEFIGYTIIPDPAPSQYCGVVMGFDSLYLPPKFQIERGMETKQVRCNAGLEGVIKSSDGTPICVKPETKQKLIERGWILNTITNNLPDNDFIPTDKQTIILDEGIDDLDSGTSFHPIYKKILDTNNTITWYNAKQKPVQLVSDENYFNVTIPPQESFSFVYDTAGIHRYYDPINWKRGTVFVSTKEIESSNLSPVKLLEKNPDEIAKIIMQAAITDDKITEMRLDNTMLSAYVTQHGGDIIIPKSLCKLCTNSDYRPIEYRFGMTKPLFYPKSADDGVIFAKDFMNKIGYVMDGTEWIDSTDYGSYVKTSIQQRVQGWIIPNHIADFVFFKDNTTITLGRWYDDATSYKFELSQDDAKEIAKDYMQKEVEQNPSLQKFRYVFQGINDAQVMIIDDKVVYVVPVSFKSSLQQKFENGHCGGPEYFTGLAIIEGKTGSVLGWDHSICM